MSTRTIKATVAAALTAVTGGLAMAACGDAGQATVAASQLPRGSERVSLDPAEFGTAIDNRYWPMSPGSRWVYRETATDGSSGTASPPVRSTTRSTGSPRSAPSGTTGWPASSAGSASGPVSDPRSVAG